MIKFELNESIEHLKKTPNVLDCLLIGTPDNWLRNNEGGSTWSPYNVVGHLIHNEQTDWIPRIKIILSDQDNKTFEPFERFYDQTIPIEQLLREFRVLREKSLLEIKKLDLSTSRLSKTGIHPAFGEVNLQQLLSAWVVHDLGHIGQITRVMAKQYKEEVGPWVEYLRVLNRT